MEKDVCLVEQIKQILPFNFSNIGIRPSKTYIRNNKQSIWNRWYKDRIKIIPKDINLCFHIQKSSAKITKENIGR